MRKPKAKAKRKIDCVPYSTQPCPKAYTRSAGNITLIHLEPSFLSGHIPELPDLIHRQVVSPPGVLSNLLPGLDEAPFAEIGPKTPGVNLLLDYGRLLLRNELSNQAQHGEIVRHLQHLAALVLGASDDFAPPLTSQAEYSICLIFTPLAGYSVPELLLRQIRRSVSWLLTGNSLYQCWKSVTRVLSRLDQTC